MSDDLPAAAGQVDRALGEFGLAGRVRIMPASTRTAAEAAATLGCAVEQIAKSLIFRGAVSGQAILVIAAGANRVDEKKLAALTGEKIERADADFVRAQTGFAIGGVPPLAHAKPLLTFIDADLLGLELLWAAAGTPHAVFPLTPDELCRITQGRICDLKKAS